MDELSAVLSVDVVVVRLAYREVFEMVENLVSLMVALMASSQVVYWVVQKDAA